MVTNLPLLQRVRQSGTLLQGDQTHSTQESKGVLVLSHSEFGKDGGGNERTQVPEIQSRKRPGLCF